MYPSINKEKYIKKSISELSIKDIGNKVRVFGWVEASRTHSDVYFIDLYAQYKILTCVVDPKNSNLNEILIEAEKEENKNSESLEELKEKLSNLGVTDEDIKSEAEVKNLKKRDIRAFISLTKKIEALEKESKGELSTKKDNLRKNITFSTTLTIYGTVKEYNGTKKLGHSFIQGIEIHAESIEMFNNKMAPSFPVSLSSKPFVKLEQGHLALRTPERRLFMKAQSLLKKLLRDFYFENDYTEVTPPTIVQTQVEGGSTLFGFDYYGSKAYLTQSSQLYLETTVPVTMKSYTTMSSYRAEKSNTVRHLSEYTHVEGELADINFDDLIESIESMIKYTSTKFYEQLKDDILEIYPDFEFYDTDVKFGRITYSEGIEFLNSKGYKKEDGSVFEIGDDVPDAAERFICREMGKPVFLTNFLIEQKPFYMRRSDVHKGTAEAVDLLYPGVGEIVGGSMRTESYSDLMNGFSREGISTDPYYWYTDLLKYGPCKHGGYGLGFERLLMALMRYESINSATLYPRFVNRAHP